MQIVSKIHVNLPMKNVTLERLSWVNQEAVVDLGFDWKDSDGFKTKIVLYNGTDHLHVELRDFLPPRLIPPFAIDFTCFSNELYTAPGALVQYALSNVLNDQTSVVFTLHDDRVDIYLTIGKWFTNGFIELTEAIAYFLPK